MQRLIVLSTVLIGPCYAVLLIGLYAGRRFVSEARILFELNESMMLLAAATIALALAGILVQII